MFGKSLIYISERKETLDFPKRDEDICYPPFISVALDTVLKKMYNYQFLRR